MPHTFQAFTKVLSTHEERIAVLRRMGYASLVFWPGTLMAHHPYNEEFWTALLFSYGVLPFITAGIAKRAFQQGQIIKAYLVSAVTAIPIAAVLLYFIGAMILGVLFYTYGMVAGLAYLISDTL